MPPIGAGQLPQGKPMQTAEVLRRYRLIELIAYWEGRVASTHLCQFFGISRQQASKDIGHYNEQRPHNLHYDAHLKGFVPQRAFERAYIGGDVAEYLGWMTGSSAHVTPDFPAYRLPHAALQHPPRNVSPLVMRPLVQAIRRRQRVDVDYVSVTNPSRDGRVIVPHTFVNTGLRWHLRAWCEKSGDYRDFVLSRFRGEPELLDSSDRSCADDLAWNTQITLILKPDPRLNHAQQEALKHDYDMVDGELRLRTRSALAQYLLKEMQVNVKMIDGTPEAQQLVLVNLDDVRPWLFNS